jgi:hypothetical protein
MTVSLTEAAMLSLARCVQGATCPWWTSDAGPAPLFIWGAFRALIGVVVLVNFLRPRDK